MGVCFYHARNYGKCFQLMRGVIEEFPTSPEVNQAYYYIGLGHFQLAHYSRAIDALEKVGTTLASDKADGNKLEAGKRFFVKIEDADLAVLDPDRRYRFAANQAAVIARRSSVFQSAATCGSCSARFHRDWACPNPTTGPWKSKGVTRSA